MSESALSDNISKLVDNLREQGDVDHSLTDIASVTEVLIGTMQNYFKGIDTSIYRECRALSEYITNARVEIASLSPSDEANDRIPRAGLELEAIVQSTEEATDTIMTSAEEILNYVAEDDINPHKEKIEAAAMNLFEACSFQDITGQRIAKVVETLSHIEGRVAELRDLMGVTEGQIANAKERDEAEVVAGKHDPLARGPSLGEEGVDQDDVDAMFATENSDAESTEPNGEKPSANADSDDDIGMESGKEAKQDDIDALFN
jgi:chemotaxis regulatin CheY-phosphate phosphatase CheZ